MDQGLWSLGGNFCLYSREFLALSINQGQQIEKFSSIFGFKSKFSGLAKLSNGTLVTSAIETRTICEVPKRVLKEMFTRWMICKYKG